MTFPITIPDRLCADEDSPYFDKAFLDLVPIIKFNGIEQKGRVVEYCISEGWVKRFVPGPRGPLVDRRGRRMTFKTFGKVEVKA